MSARPIASEEHRSLGARLRRGEVLKPDCPSRGILEHLTGRWAVLVLVALLDGTHRFSELRRKVGGVSEKMLSQTLKTLEADGFVSRVSHPVVPPHVEYSLTPLGVAAARRVEGLTDWIEENVEAITSARTERAATSP